MFKAFVTVPTVRDSLGAVYSSDVDGKQLIREDCRLQNSSFKSCNLKLSFLKS